MKGQFGSKGGKTGAKALSQAEWDAMTAAVTNTVAGENGFNVASQITGRGLEIPCDSFFFPHVAEVHQLNSTEAVIGFDRAEDWYPYVDSLSVPMQTVRYNLKSGPLTAPLHIDSISTDTLSKSVSFPTALTITPIKPADGKDCAIVGYRWTLVPKIRIIQEKDDPYWVQSFYEVVVDWEPHLSFDEDTNAELFTVDSGVNPENWVPTYGVGTTEYSLADMIDAWFIAEGETPWTYPPDATLNDLKVEIAVARYDWNSDQTNLDRCIQLLFGSAVPGGSAGMGTAPGSSVDHPFKSRIYPSDSTYVEVGFLRPAWKDLITIYDPFDGGDAQPSLITFTSAEQIALTASGYVYYRIKKRETDWTAELETSSVYIPLDETDPDRWFLIGYAEWDATLNEGAGGVANWRQHAFECPEFHMPKPQIHSFEGLPIRNDADTDDMYQFSTGSVSVNDVKLATTDKQKISVTTSEDVYFIVELDFNYDDFDAFTVPGVLLVDELGAGTTDLQVGVISRAQEWQTLYKLWLRVKVGGWDGDDSWHQNLMSDLIIPPFTVFNDEFTSAYHGQDSQVPRMIGGTGKAFQGSNMYIDDDGTVEIMDADETAISREFAAIKHDGTDAHLYASNLGAGTTALQIQKDAKATIKLYDGIAGSSDNKEIHASFYPSSAKRKLVIKSSADQEITFEGATPGTDFTDWFLNKLDLHIKSAGNTSSFFPLLVEDSAGTELFSIRGDGRTRVGDAWNVPLAAPTAGNQVIKAVTGDLQNPVWSAGETVTVITAVQLDASNNLQVKTTTINVLAKGTESAWTTVTGWTTTACP